MCFHLQKHGIPSLPLSSIMSRATLNEAIKGHDVEFSFIYSGFSADFGRIFGDLGGVFCIFYNEFLKKCVFGDLWESLGA